MDKKNNDALDLPRDQYGPVLDQSMDMELLNAEITVSAFDVSQNHVFKTCYGDVRKIVDALRDYSKLLEMVCVTWELQGYHKAVYELRAQKLREIAGKLQAGIGYDYDAAMARCEKQKAKSSVMTMWAARPLPWGSSEPSRQRRPRLRRPLRRIAVISLLRLKLSQRMIPGQMIFR